MKSTTLFGALNLASTVFLSFVKGALVSGFVTINNRSSYEDGNYALKELRIGKKGVALFWNTARMETETKFVNNGIFFQTSDRNPEAPRRTIDKPALSRLQFDNRFMNNGDFIYDYSSAYSTSTFVAFSKRIVNLGNMWFEIGAVLGRPADDSADVWFQAQERFRNLGYIEIAGKGPHVASLKITKGLLGPSDTVPTDMRKFSIVNRGHILLRQAAWELKTNIRGYGCVSLTDGAHLSLDDRIHYFMKQKIFFNPKSAIATLHIDVHNGGHFFRHNLFGFSENCVILFSEVMRWFEYRDSSLFVYRGTRHRSYELKIGPNYDPGSFEFDQDDKAIIYKGTAPKVIPKKCERRYYYHLVDMYLYS